MLPHTPNHSTSCGTVQGRHRTAAPQHHLCSAWITHKCLLLPTHRLQNTFFFPARSFFVPSHLQITSQCTPQAGSQNKAECMLMRGNILLMQKVNQGDKFKSFLSHYYRQVLQSLIRSIENFKRYGNQSKMGCFLWRTAPSCDAFQPGPSAWLSKDSAQLLQRSNFIPILTMY